MNNPVRFYFE